MAVRAGDEAGDAGVVGVAGEFQVELAPQRSGVVGEVQYAETSADIEPLGQPGGQRQAPIRLWCQFFGSGHHDRA